MPFGATVAGNVFQWKLDSIFLNLENVMIITDDIMVIGYQEDESDHDKAFTQLLETAKKNNIKLNFHKIQYKQKEVEFLEKPTQNKDANLVIQRSRQQQRCTIQRI